MTLPQSMAGRTVACPHCSVEFFATPPQQEKTATPLVPTRPSDDSPDELIQYCDANNLNGLALLALIGDVSSKLSSGTTRDEGTQGAVAKHYFAYSLAYGIWVGETCGKLQWCDVHRSRRTLSELPLNVFGTGTQSQSVAEMIHRFYKDEANLALADTYYGPFFEADVPFEVLRQRCESNLVFLHSLWDEWGWDESTFERALRDVYAPRRAPTSFYAEEPPVMREFWNFLLVTVINEKYWHWSFEEELTRWPMNTVLLTAATQQIRMLVLASQIHSF
jgi:hypothetical protein